MRTSTLAIAMAFLCSVSNPSIAQAPPPLKLRQYMTAQEFKEAGLEKLTPSEYQALEQWFNQHTVNVYRVAKGEGASRTNRVRPTGSGYEVEQAINDETFIINGNVYKAKTYCMSLDKGDRVVFAEGSALGACASAKLVNLRNGDVCDVWCE